MRHQSERIDKILVVRPRYVGDVLLTTPTLRTLKESFPRAHLTFLASPAVADVVERCPYVDEVLMLDKKGQHRGLAGKLRLIRDLRQREFDLAVVLMRSFSSALYPFLAGCRLRIGFDTEWRGPLLTHKVPYDTEAYEAECFLSVLKTIGIEGRTCSMEMRTTGKDRAFADGWCKEKGIGQAEKVVFVNSGSSSKARRVEPAKLARVSDRVIEKYGARVIVVWGPGERGLDETVVRTMNRPALLAPATSLPQLAALLERGDLLITSNSGPLHIAAAVGTRTVTLFGPYDPQKWNPQDRKHLAVTKPIDCRPCKGDSCHRGYACMGLIEVDDILDAVAQAWLSTVLESDGARRPLRIAA